MTEGRQYIAIVTDEPGWHGRKLKDAFASRGFGVVFLSLNDCRIELTGELPSLILPGFNGALPVGVFVRGVAGGTLEQVIVRLDILHMLRQMGITVYNDARAIERTVDKAMTSFLLKHAGIPTPATWICESDEQARAIIMREISQGRALVCKPVFGSQGVGVKLVDTKDGLTPQEITGGVYYLQAYIDRGENNWYDWRVFVIGGRASAAMIRRGTGWITNRAQGARCEAATIDGELQRMAEAASRAVDIDYAGVDLVRDRHGNLYVIEINGIPAWKGLQEVCSLDIGGCLADHFCARLAGSGGLAVVP
ncbi:MAG: RimK family alpha-L-glutamate ligase [Gammaproteobacteria bacterium]|nr:RimK family alpha-L-glutamate ligase [Gammaproteobacteria bacterium]MCI0591648.1 RimK family alpha-L-glutamate ligase [Gammaproteobacteria bacterium]